MGLGRTRPDRGRDGDRGGQGQRGREPGRGRLGARPDRVRDRCRCLPGLVEGPPGRGGRAAGRGPVRHRAAAAPDRGGAGPRLQLGGGLLHEAEREPGQARPHLVAARRPGRRGQVPDLVRALHRLPRGRARPSPAGGRGHDGGGRAVPLRQVRVRERARRRLGPVRRTAGRRARLVRRAGHPARHAERIGAARGPGGHRHRRPPGPAAARRLPVDVRAGLRRAARARPGRAAPGARRGSPLLRLARPGHLLQARRARLAVRPRAGHAASRRVRPEALAHRRAQPRADRPGRPDRGAGPGLISACGRRSGASCPANARWTPGAGRSPSP